MTTIYKCPTEGCDTEMELIEVSRVYGETPIEGLDEPVRELLIDQPVGIFYCEKCSHSLIIQQTTVKDEVVIKPEEPRIILL